MRRRVLENPRGPARSERSRDEAVHIRETFYNKPAEQETEMPWSWPTTLVHAGEAFAVMYRSDKWHKKGDFEDYKHICEGRKPWDLFAVPDAEIRDEDGEPIELVGKERKVPAGEMPSSFAVLANCLGVQGRFYREHGSRIVMPQGDDNIYQVQFARSKLASGKTRSGKMFLCVYVENEGPKLFIFGTELDVEKDGIVG